MHRLGVLGWPVAHSRSPAIHNAALTAMGLSDWHYQRLPVPPLLFEETVRGLAGAGFVGANVTIPHKEVALALATEASPTALAIGAANTLTFAGEGEIVAENTDAPGLIAALGFTPGDERPGARCRGQRQGSRLGPLGRRGRAGRVWNRTAERAERLCAELGATPTAAPRRADLLVNCTSVGLSVERSATEAEALNHLLLSGDQVGEYSHVADLVYRTGSTPLLAAAEARGLGTTAGLEILIAQGALSLEGWTKHFPPLEVMRAAAVAEA